jgi:hypothetical protein
MISLNDLSDSLAHARTHAHIPVIHNRHQALEHTLACQLVFHLELVTEEQEPKDGIDVHQNECQNHRQHQRQAVQCHGFDDVFEKFASRNDIQ